MANPVWSRRTSPGSTTTPSASMTSCRVARSTAFQSWPRWWARSTSTPRPCTPWNAMCSRPRWRANPRCPLPSPLASSDGPDQVGAGPVAVVVDGLLDAVAVGVELGADVGERVPLGRVLQRERDDVVGPDVDVLRVAEVRHLAHVDVVEDVRRAVHVLGGGEARGMAALVQGGAAGEVEREAEAERASLLHLGHALQHLLGRHQVDAAELVVVAEVAPGRAIRTLRPSRGGLAVRHRWFPLSLVACTDRLV